MLKLNIAKNEWERSLNLSEKKVFKYYTSDGYETINSQLLELGANGIIEGSENISPEDLKRIKILDGALSKFILPENITVFRGECRENIDIDTFERIHRQVKNFYYPNYMSTSLIETVAVNRLAELDFLFNKTPKTFCLMECDLEAGENAGYLGNSLSSIANESEILVMRNKNYIIKSFERINKNGRMILKIKGIIKTNKGGR